MEIRINSETKIDHENKIHNFARVNIHPEKAAYRRYTLETALE